MMNLRQILVAAIMIAALVGLSGEKIVHQSMTAIAADPIVTEPAGKETAEGESDDNRPPAKIPTRPTQKQIKAYSGLAALAGIVIAGLALAALTILWAGRLRRQLRRPLPECDAPGRDFWFLKPPKPTVTQSSLPDAHQPPHVSPSDET
ncbi:MAG: hypothetical protein WCJ09_06380 [Planctomycetota bacterium]